MKVWVLIVVLVVFGAVFWGLIDATNAQRPPPPTPNSPGTTSPPGEVIDTLTPTFRWTSVSEADYYGLYISKYPYGSANLVFESDKHYGPLYGSSFTLPSGYLQNGVKYRWDMNSYNSVGGWGSVSSDLYIQVVLNQPPTCFLSANPKSGSAPLTVTFSMSASDPDGWISAWVLDVNGDGNADYSGTGNPPTTKQHTYTTQSSGSGYSVVLMVSDNDGTTAFDTETVVVGSPNQPPTCSLSANPKSGKAPLTVTFSMSANDLDGSIESWVLRPGDGSPDYLGSGSPPPTLQHIYQTSKSYTPILMVSDDDDAIASDTETVTVNPPNQLPTCSLSANPKSGSAPLTVTFSMSASDPDGWISAWVLDVNGDGNADYSGTGNPPATQQHTYQNAGSYTPILAVSDNDSAVTFDTETITVNPPDQDITLTLYVHYGRETGPLLSGVRVTGNDAGGTSFDKTTGAGGYVTITGVPGLWHFKIEKTGYKPVEWDQSITMTCERDAFFLEKLGPVLTSPLEITPDKETHFVGDTLSAEFTIKNEKAVPITLDVLTVGGRLNGWCPSEGCPDFSFYSLTLQPDVPYHYTGTLTVTQPGYYLFFVAYYIENPTPDEKVLLDKNNWNTCIGLEAGLTDQDRAKSIIVLEEEIVPTEVTELRDKINRQLHRQSYYIPYLPDPNSFTNAVASLWASFTDWISGTDLIEQYDEFYYAGLDYNCLRTTALVNARNSLDKGDIANAKKYLEDSYTYDRLSSMSFAGAADVYIGNLEAGMILAEGIKDGCQASVKFGLSVVNPEAAKAADYVYNGVDFAVECVLLGEEQATKNLIVQTAVSALFNEIKIKELGGRTLSDYSKNKIGKVTFPMLQDTFKNNEEVQYALSKIIKEAGVTIEEAEIDILVSSILEELGTSVNLEESQEKSPVELQVYDSTKNFTGIYNGKVEHGLPQSMYCNGKVTIFFPAGTNRYVLRGTDSGLYEFFVVSIDNGKEIDFSILSSTQLNATHQYSFNWTELAQGGAGVVLNKDEDGDGTFEENITIQPPIANFTYLPENPVVSQAITFNASNSTDQDGFITNYNWNFGDETNATGKITTHSYPSVGNYTVTLTVRDNDGATKSTFKVIKVSDGKAPQTMIETGPAGTINYNDVTFTWSGSDDVTPAAQLAYSCMLDGYETAWSAWTSNTSKSYSNLPNGAYTFKVKAKDQAGNEGTPASRSFTVSVTVETGRLGGGGGGEGGAALLVPPNVPIDPATGAVQSTTRLTADGATLTIPAGTIVKDAEGKPLSRITYATITAESIGAISAYDYGPSGATFSPSLDLVIAYDLAAIPQGFSESDLVIRMWDGSAWIDFDTTIDTVTHTATAKVSHFTLFALFAIPRAPTPLPMPMATPTVTPTVTPTLTPTPPVFKLPAMSIVVVVIIALVVVALIIAGAYRMLGRRT
ncbi:MAG: PKD domain-containing protein [Methanophagales archaeon ANME-1-THS]|nr:MAG: PKD domain-containing protein [Methanophagales archaeon ANME-1-THS]